MAIKLLIADESDAIRSVAVNIFRQRGLEVLTASGGAEAWEIIRGGKIDLLIINSSISGMDGYTVSKLIKEDQALVKTKVVLLLSPSEIVNQHQLITAQPDGTLSKPFSPPDLLNKVSDVLNIKFTPPDNNGKDDLKGSVSELDASEDQVSEEIDFNSIFSDDEKSAEPDNVHLEEIIPKAESSEKDKSQVEEIPMTDNQDSQTNTTEEGVKQKGDSIIRLEEDQFGMEKPLEQSEIEPPHDYNWFIREMQNEISGKVGADEKTGKKDDSKGFMDGDAPTGKFTVEEIKTSTHEVIETEKGSGKTKTGNTSQTIPVAKDKMEEKVSEVSDDSKLALAEKLLVKELARKLADKIIEQIPRANLQAMLSEIISELKKY